MGSDRRSEIEALFERALELPRAERRLWLDRASAADPELRAEVERMLIAHERAEGILEQPVQDIAGRWIADSDADAPQPATVGPYSVLREAGRGGMGVVYQARHQRLGRLAALKLLPPHLAAEPQARDRFMHEARAASALDHPNICTIYDIGEAQDGRTFLAMAWYDGATLRDALAHGALPVDVALDYAMQIGRALSAAHGAGIVHRDVKPANVLITGAGQVKLLDFGLAKLEGDAAVTQPGMRMGTVGYMSPEQARGERTDHRTDIWALGVVLYEMLTGERPFRGESEAAVLRSILDDSPVPIAALRSDVPSGLARVVDRALAKDTAARYQSAAALIRDIEALGTNARVGPGSITGRVRQLSRSPRAVAAVAAAVVLAGTLFVPYRRNMQRSRAEALLPGIEQAALAGDYAAAYRLAEQVENHLGHDSMLARWMPVISDRLTIITRPAGARVHLQAFAPDDDGRFPDSVQIGLTPIRNLRVARADYRVIIDSDGYVPLERTVSSGLLRAEGPFFGNAVDIRIDVDLLSAHEATTGMVFVPGGSYQLVGRGAPTTSSVMLDDYLIDRYEVSNRDYLAFIRAGGYANRSLWQHAFMEDERELPWVEAVRRLTDRTGLPGPRHWTGQQYPMGEGAHPVTNITWHEAAAYAVWAGKRLPTAFEWEKAARDGLYTRIQHFVMPWGLVDPAQPAQQRANFSGQGTAPVDAYPFGASPYGAYNMAGNVKEWLFNGTGAGQLLTGGSWRDPMYVFSEYGSLPAFATSPEVGFRCARTIGDAGSDQGGMRIDFDRQTPRYTPVDEQTFRGLLTHYRYDVRPLQAETVDVRDDPDWTRETVHFAGAGDDRVTAYLYLPKRATPPFQTVVFVPSSAAFFEMDVPRHTELLLAPHIRAGRAVLAVVLDGMIGRSRDPAAVFPDPGSVRFRELMVSHATELSRSIDFLETRDDIDSDRLAYFSFSWGAGSRLVFAAVEKRYRSVVLLGGGIDERVKPNLPEADNVNFAPYIGAPTLLLNGEHDEEHPYLTRALPLWNLLREPKKLVLVEGGHLPSAELRVPVINDWFDQTLGPVRR